MVGDIRARGLERTSEPQVYLSSKQDPDGWFTYYAPKDLVIHSSQPPEASAARDPADHSRGGSRAAYL